MGRWVGGQVGRWAGGQVGRWCGWEVGRWVGGLGTYAYTCVCMGSSLNTDNENSHDVTQFASTNTTCICGLTGHTWGLTKLIDQEQPCIIGTPGDGVAWMS